MLPMIHLAVKDLKILWRDKLAAFFILVFPILMGLFFGMVFGGQGGPTHSPSLVVVDEDQSDASRDLVQMLMNNPALSIQQADRVAAQDAVRKGQHDAFLILPQGYGETAGVVWQLQSPLPFGVDPSKSAEGAMIEGHLMQAGGQLMMEQFLDPERSRSLLQGAKRDAMQSDDLNLVQKGLLNAMYDQFELFLNSVNAVQSRTRESADSGGVAMTLLNLEKVPITTGPPGGAPKPPSGFAVSFPQGMIWGVLACCAGFAISIARERSRGTLLRLQASPLPVNQVLQGKALACFLAVVAVLTLMTTVGYVLGMTPEQPWLLVVSGVMTAICFVGIMMTMAVLGKTEESVSGSGWAINMVMAMIGGGMIPLAVMPEFFARLSVISPVRWAIFSLEGAIWRQLTVQELWIPWLVLGGIGALGCVLGTVGLKRSFRAK